MKKKSIKVLAILLILLIMILAINTKVFAAGTENVDISLYSYEELEDGTIKITGFDFDGIMYNTDLKIPSKINGKTVTQIGEYAFYYGLELGTVTIPDTVKTIERYAFANSYNMKSVTLGNSVQSIGDGAFCNSKITSTQVIPDSVKEIGSGAFMGNPLIDEYEVGSNNTAYISVNGVLYNKSKTELIAYPPAKQDTTFTMPSTVTKIGENAFTNNQYITTITLGAKVNEISTTAFVLCKGLTTINVNAQNTNFSSQNGVLFNKDKTILKLYPIGKTETYYIVPTTVKTIGENAFLDAKIKSIAISEGVTTLGDWCFGRSSLETIAIPKTVTKMGYGLFTDCEELTKATIESSCDLPYSMFASCKKLVDVTLNDNIKILDSRVFYNCTSLTSITLPSKLEKIEYSFIGCSGLKNVVIPANVTYIGDGSFHSATVLDISKTKLTKLESGTYVIINEVYLKGQFNYDKAYEVLDIVNQERAEQGLSALKMDESLLRSAMQRAAETSVYFDHTRTDSTDCYTIDSKMSGENIAAGSSTSTGVMNQWMNSPGHKSNILNGRWQSIGIGCFCINNIWYWVQCFGDDVAEEPNAKPTNSTEIKKINVLDEYISLNVDTSDVSLEIGETKNAKTMYTINTGWTIVKTQIQPQSFTWTSSNTKVATVTSKGVVKGVAAGTATITAKIGEKSISYKVIVKAPSIDIEQDTPITPTTSFGVSYYSHVQDYGWETTYSKSNGQTTGKTGEGKKVEAIKIKLSNAPQGISILYKAHVQDIGWENWVKDGAQSGTTGQNKKVEAIRIKLDNVNGYSVMYRAYVQGLGWQDWVTDGGLAGTTGRDLKLEALEVKIVESSKSTMPTVKYYSHIQDIGWETSYCKSNGQTSGTVGKGKKVEAIKIQLEGMPQNGKILYQSHVQDIGWEGWGSNGAQSGTTGQNKKIEAMRIRLENMSDYSVLYRAYVQGKGWQPWVRDGEDAGTTGYNLKLEAIQIKIVERNKTTSPQIQYYSHVQDIGWEATYSKENGVTTGTTGKGLKVEAIKIHLLDVPEGANILYQSHVQDIGWEGWVSNGAQSGTTGQNKKVEAIRIKLEGLHNYSVMYRAYIQGKGWQSWVKDGALAGTTGQNLKLEALQVKIVEK